MVELVQAPHARHILLSIWIRVLCTFALILAIITSSILVISLADGQTILKNGTRIQPAKDLKVYDSEFFSIKYPNSWFVSAERGIFDLPRSSGVTLLHQIDMNHVNHKNRVTARSNVEPTIIAISVLPKMAFPRDARNSNISEILDSLIDYSYSSQKLSESGDQLLTDNSTYLSGHHARSISYISNAPSGGMYN